MNDLKVNKKQKNFGLQILRSIACIFIFLSHYNAFHHLTGYFDAGGFGVSIFIVLSGFLKIVYVKNNNSNEQFETSLIYNFLRKTVTRFKKIYPLHIFTMLLAIPFEFTMIIAGEVSVFHLIFSLFLNLFMIQSFIPLGSYYFSLNAVSWYLSLVLIFTLAGDLLVIICNIIHKKVKLLGAIIFWISLQIILTLIFQFNSHFHWLLYINPFTRCIDFALGITIGVAFRNSYNRTKSNGLLLVYAGISLLLTILGIIISHVTMKTKYEAWSLAVCFTPASLMLVLTFALYAVQVCAPPPIYNRTYY